MARPKDLPKDIIVKIRQLYGNNNITQTELTLQFGVSQSTICKIINHDIHKKAECLQLCGAAAVRLGLKY